MAEKRLTAVARRLRRDMTDAERLLWSYLREGRLAGAKFTRQFPIGDHIVDFACRRLKLVIECNGGHHGGEEDALRTRAIVAYGYRVIRFWNNDILQKTDGGLQVIAAEVMLARNE